MRDVAHAAVVCSLPEAMRSSRELLLEASLSGSKTALLPLCASQLSRVGTLSIVPVDALISVGQLTPLLLLRSAAAILARSVHLLSELLASLGATLRLGEFATGASGALDLCQSRVVELLALLDQLDDLLPCLQRVRIHLGLRAIHESTDLETVACVLASVATLTPLLAAAAWVRNGSTALAQFAGPLA